MIRKEKGESLEGSWVCELTLCPLPITPITFKPSVPTASQYPNNLIFLSQSFQHQSLCPHILTLSFPYHSNKYQFTTCISLITTQLTKHAFLTFSHPTWPFISNITGLPRPIIFHWDSAFCTPYMFKCTLI